MPPRAPRRPTSRCRQSSPPTIFGLFVVVALSAGLVFNTISVSLPKIVDERVGNDISLIAVGGLTTAVFLCGALAQITVGRLVERFPLHILFAALAIMQFGGVVWAAYASGVTLVVCAGLHHGRDLRPDHRERSRHRPLYRRRLARPRLCGALFPHLHDFRCRGVDDRACSMAAAVSALCSARPRSSRSASSSRCWRSR